MGAVKEKVACALPVVAVKPVGAPGGCTAWAVLGLICKSNVSTASKSEPLMRLEFFSCVKNSLGKLAFDVPEKYQLLPRSARKMPYFLNARSNT